MESRWFRSTATLAAVAMLAVPASAQNTAYINLLQFDLQSYRSQATGGIFHDDVDHVANASRLLQVGGTRLFTNFANLNDEATLGDNLISYDTSTSTVSHVGNPSQADVFDTGSFLTGWIGKYNDDSEYVFSAFVQRNASKTMFEDLQDGNIGGSPVGSNSDAEYAGSVRTTTNNPADGSVTADQTTTFDLMNYDDRSAWNWDIGGARGLSADLDIGGRVFYKRDQLDRNRSGTTTVVNRTLNGGTNELEVTDSQTTEWFGLGEDAFRYSEVGLSLNGDYHPWSNQSVNVRLDIYGTNMTNPNMGLSNDLTRGLSPLEDPVGFDIDGGQLTDATPVSGDQGALGVLNEARENTSNTVGLATTLGGGAPSLGVVSVNDERDGIGVNFLAEYDRAWARGDTRTWVGLSRRPFDIDSNVMSRAAQFDQFWYNDGTTDRQATNTASDRTVTESRSGDMTHTTLEAGTRYWREVSRRVNVGLGVVVTRSTWNEDYSRTLVDETVSAFSDGNDAVVNGVAGFNEFRNRTTTTTTSQVDDELRNTIVRFPVGTQFRFGNWTWNMGLTHSMIHATRETNTSNVNNGTITVTNDIGAGTGDVTTFDTSGSSEDTTTTDRSRINQTAYWYGLEWMFSDAARININGFFDTYESGATEERDVLDVEFFQNLALSITFLLD